MTKRTTRKTTAPAKKSGQDPLELNPRKRKATKWGEQMRWVFPDPGPTPEHSGLAPAQWSVRALIHKAVHTNDPEARERLALMAWWRFHGHDKTGEYTPIAEDDPLRGWLLFVLGQLIDRQCIPHLAVGNSVATESERIQDARDVYDIVGSRPPIWRGLTKRFEIAAERLNKSYSAVRKIYYSEVYKQWSDAWDQWEESHSIECPPR